MRKDAILYYQQATGIVYTKTVDGLVRYGGDYIYSPGGFGFVQIRDNRPLFDIGQTPYALRLGRFTEPLRKLYYLEVSYSFFWQDRLDYIMESDMVRVCV